MPVDLSSWALGWVGGAVVACAVVIVLTGVQLARRAEELAVATGVGQALMGAVLLGATTSLPGVVLSVTAAARGLPDLAISNAIGGILAQTAFLAVADLAYRPANLEHAAASAENLAQGTLLIGLLSMAALAAAGPEVTWLGVSPFTPAMLVVYGYAVRQLYQVRSTPMWKPHLTRQTKEEKRPAATRDAGSIRPLATGFAALALIAGSAGFCLTIGADELAKRTGLSHTAMGGLVTSVVTSLPELVTSVAAVRRGALNLAVGGILGGNAFDVLFLAFADVGYRDGSLFAAFSSTHVFTVAAATLMAAAILMGLIKRERRGPANIGFEGVAVLGIYGVAVYLMASS